MNEHENATHAKSAYKPIFRVIITAKKVHDL